MKNILFGLLFASSAHAADLPKDFSGARWEALVAKAVRTGQPLQSRAGLYMVLSRVEGSEDSGAIQKEYFSVRLGDSSAPDAQVIEDVAPVSEAWTKQPDGSWQIHQEIFHVTIFGKLVDVLHVDLTRSANGSIAGRHETKDPRALDLWARELAKWE